MWRRSRRRKRRTRGRRRRSRSHGLHLRLHPCVCRCLWLLLCLYHVRLLPLFLLLRRRHRLLITTLHLTYRQPHPKDEAIPTARDVAAILAAAAALRPTFEGFSQPPPTVPTVAEGEEEAMELDSDGEEDKAPPPPAPTNASPGPSGSQVEVQVKVRWKTKIWKCQALSRRPMFPLHPSLHLRGHHDLLRRIPRLHLRLLSPKHLRTTRLPRLNRGCGIRDVGSLKKPSRGPRRSLLSARAR